MDSELLVDLEGLKELPPRLVGLLLDVTEVAGDDEELDPKGESSFAGVEEDVVIEEEEEEEVGGVLDRSGLGTKSVGVSLPSGQSGPL